MLTTCLQTEVQTVDGQSGLFAETEALHVDVQGVVGQCTQVDMGADVTQAEVGRIEETLGLGFVVLVESDVGMADDQRVDAKVEWGMGRRVFAGEGVDQELAVHRRIGIVTVQTHLGAEQLGRGYRYLSFHQRQHIHLHRYPRSTYHLLLLLVEDDKVVENDTVKESEIYPSDADGGA